MPPMKGWNFDSAPEPVILQPGRHGRGDGRDASFVKSPAQTLVANYLPARLLMNASRNNDTTDFQAAPTAETTEIVLPNDANILGNILGGKVMHLIDITAAIAAARHCRKPLVTVSVDYLEFRHPVKVGDLIIIKAALNRAFHTSMEIGAKVWSENLLSGERKHTSSAYLTFVALDEQGQPVAVPTYTPVTVQEKRRWREAELRRANRLQIKERLRKLED